MHTDDTVFDHIKVAELDYVIDSDPPPPPGVLTFQLCYTDVRLDSFISCQPQISELFSGDSLNVDTTGCMNAEGRRVLMFSRSFSEKLKTLEKSGYMPDKAYIRHIFYWKKENAENEIRIMLPEIAFTKNTVVKQDPPGAV